MLKRVSVLCLLLSCLIVSSAWPEIYKWTDADGKVHFTDNPKESPNVEQITIRVNSYEHVTISDTVATASDQGSSQKVVIYTTEWCGYCKKAKKYFQENNIDYTDYDIEKDTAARARYNALGGKGVPIILVGSKRMNGFSIDGFRKIYN